MEGMEASERPGIHSNRRAMSTSVAAVVMVIIVIIGGVGAYAAFSSSPAATSTTTTCSPASACVTTVNTNDVTMFIPYTVGAGQKYSQVAAESSVQATVGVTGSETIQTFSVTWAPGVSTSSGIGTLSYTYPLPGLYTLLANATTPSGVLHTGFSQLVALKVNPSAQSIGAGYYPTVSATLTNSSGGAYPWVEAGGSVTVNGTYTAPPANALFSTAAPTLSTPAGSSQSGLVQGPTYVSATYKFTNPGYYGINLVVGSTGPLPPSGHPGTTYQNYTFGVYVAPTGTSLSCALCKVPQESTPHPSKQIVYTTIAGGALTLDPAADYYSVGYEVGQAFDETLIGYNGTDTGQTPNNFVPEIATCVPGSGQCASLYSGNTLVNYTSGNYTFVIDPAAHFYDPYTGVSRPIYPSDVMFSIIRAIMYTQVAGITGYYAGFDIAGPLVPQFSLAPQDVNPNWDLGLGGFALHSPYNNTPLWTYNSMAINDTANCPTVGGKLAGNGCITFHANADGKSWPAFLQIMAIISLGGIQEAGWYTSQGANVPGFVCSPNVDVPCKLPGGTNSTTNPQFENAVKAMPYTAWDTQETAALANYPTPVPAVTWAEVGSGPYYLSYANPGVGYVIQANPSYQQPTGCAGQSYCLPAPGHYTPAGIEYWGTSDTVGIQEVQAGYADSASFLTSHYKLMLQLIQNGQLGLINFPTLDTANFGFNLNIDLALLKQFDSATINIPANAFAYIGLRATLEYAYPYLTAQSVGNVINGIDLGEPFGGFLPSSETAFYAANVPWPNYNNVTHTFSNPNTAASASTPGSPAWYWAQANTPGSALYDPQLSSYTSSSPLYIPVMGFTTAPNINAQEVAWGNSVANLTGGVVQFQQFFVPSTSEDYSYLTPGQVPWAVWWFGWIPDYPAPVNNWQGAYGTGLWGGADALYPTLTNNLGNPGPTNASTCGNYGYTLANLTYWANYPNAIIPQVCQGTALNVTTYFIDTATYTSNVSLAHSLWDYIQAVYNNLQLTIGSAQSNALFTYAPWINPATINENVMYGGGGEWSWYQIGGNGMP